MKRIFRIITSITIAFIVAGCDNKSNYDPNNWYDTDNKDEEKTENVVGTDGLMKLMSFNVRYGSAKDEGNKNNLVIQLRCSAIVHFGDETAVFSITR